jgi:membrane fusion protein (multidrug efflux system)
MSDSFNVRIGPAALDESAPKAPACAQTAIVAETVVPIVEEASGAVQAKRRTMVSSRIMAAIRELRVSAGDEVAEGEVLAVLDDRDLAAKVTETQRAIEGLAAARANAKKDQDRMKELLTRGVIGHSEFDQADSAFKVADAKLEEAKRSLEGAKVALSFAEIKAPAAGRIVERYAEPGDIASPGSPLLSLYDPASLRLEAPVRESLATTLAVGESIDVRLGSEQEPLDGVISEIVPQAEAGSRTFLVKIDLPNREGVFTGMFARALIPAGERRRLLIPENAVEQIGQLSFVSVAGPERALSRRLITLGQKVAPGQIEVLSGLSAGESVLLP